MRLITDIDAGQAKRILETLYEETDIFSDYSLADVDGMS